MNITEKSRAMVLFGLLTAAASQAATVVDFELNPGVGTNYTAQTALSTLSTNATYAWNAENPLFSGSDIYGQEIHGGFMVFGETGSYTADLQLSNNPEAEQAFIQLDGLNDLADVNSRLMLLWNIDSAIAYTTFDKTTNSFFSVTFGDTYNLKGYRYVIREDASHYYLSNIQTNQLTGSNLLLKWGEFDPNNFTRFDTYDGGKSLGVLDGPFLQRTFTNVTGVGIIADIERSDSYTAQFRINDMQVGLNNEQGERAVPENAELVVDMDRSTFTNIQPARDPSVYTANEVNNKITYDLWLGENDQLFNLPTSDGGTTKVFGAYALTGADNTVDWSDFKLQTPWIGSYGTEGGIQCAAGKVSGATGEMNVRALMLWQSDQFLVSDSYIFDQTEDSYFKIDVSSWSACAINAVVQSDGKYYVSQNTYNYQKNWIHRDILLIDGANSTWAEFTATEYTNFTYNAAGFGLVDTSSTSFESRTLSNVTAVGFIGHAYRNGDEWAPSFTVEDIDVQLVTNNGSTPSNPAYAAWAATWPSEDLSNMTADNDGDGVANYAEFIINGNPTDASNRGYTELAISDTSNSFSYNLPADTNGLSWRVLDTTNLTSGVWNTNFTPITESGPHTDNGYITITNRFTSSTDQGKFYKLEIIIPE